MPTDDSLGFSLSAISRAHAVTRVETYERDVVVSTRVVNSAIAPRPSTVSPKRGPIVRFSSKSADRLRFAIRNLPDAQTLLTATYPSGVEVSSERFRRDWRRMREWLVQQGCPGLMVRETDERGLPHVHAVLQGVVDEAKASQEWSRIVGSGDAFHVSFGVKLSKVVAPVGLANYLAKPGQKQLPNGWTSMGRVWALYGGARVDPINMVEGDASAMSDLARELYAHKVVPVHGYGWGRPQSFRVRMSVDRSRKVLGRRSLQTDVGSVHIE